MTKGKPTDKHQDHIKKVVLSRLKRKNERTNTHSGNRFNGSKSSNNKSQTDRNGKQSSYDSEDPDRRGISLTKMMKGGPKMYNIKKHEQQVILEENQKKRYEALKKKLEKKEKAAGGVGAKRQLYSTDNDDEDDPLLRARDEDIHIREEQKRIEDQRAEKKEHHDRCVKQCIEFIKPILKRAEKSIALSKEGKSPLHDFDPLVKTPLDVFTLYPHFDPSQEVVEAFEYLLKKKMVFTSTSYHLSRIQPQQRAAMVRLEKKVAALQSILEKENKYQAVKQKQYEKHKTNKMLRQRTSRGQPVMKNQIHHLLGKLGGSIP